MARCALNSCEMLDGETVCPECGELQPMAALSAERAYWQQRQQRQPQLLAVRRTLAWLGEAALTCPRLHKRLLDQVDILTA